MNTKWLREEKGEEGMEGEEHKVAVGGRQGVSIKWTREERDW